MDRGKEDVSKQTLSEKKKHHSSSASRAGFRPSNTLTASLAKPVKRTVSLKLDSEPPATGRVKGSNSHTESSSDICERTGSVTEAPTEIALELSQGKRDRRYIAFIGNLPFSATAEEVVDHFARRGVRLSEVRLLTSKQSGESRGCCFAEFPNSKTLQASNQQTLCMCVKWSSK